MSWPAVLLYAVGTAALTALFLLLPVFKDTSFEHMGSTMEAWVFFAVILMANCKTPLESALKTFVFFLVSQPLIYLFQVPFSFMGWGLFGYYGYWFLWTLLTFPMAWAGWFITKKNWISVVIFAPAFVLLAGTAFGAFQAVLSSFPHLLVTLLFCVGQILLYIIVFFPKPLQKVVGALVPVITVILLLPRFARLSLEVTDNLPDEPRFSASAEIVAEDGGIANAQFIDPETARVYLHVSRYGSTDLVVTDGGEEYRYLLEVYDDGGVARIRMTPKTPAEAE